MSNSANQEELNLASLLINTLFETADVWFTETEKYAPPHNRLEAPPKFNAERNFYIMFGMLWPYYLYSDARKATFTGAQEEQFFKYWDRLEIIRQRLNIR